MASTFTFFRRLNLFKILSVLNANLPATNSFRCKLNSNVFSVKVHAPEMSFLVSTDSHFLGRRYKYKKSKEEDSDEEDLDETEESDAKLITGHLGSLRVDAVLKAGLGMARNKIETAFYESKLRVNGRKLHKKSQKVNIDDEIDLIKSVNKMNDNFIDVSRIIVVSAKEHEDGDKLTVKMKRYKTLTIENYDDSRVP